MFLIPAVPSLKDLYKQITPEYAPFWREIGILLGLSDAKIRIIQANNPSDVKRCCNEMLAQWLRVDPDASWEKLFAAINSLVISSSQHVENQRMCIIIRPADILVGI